MFVVRTNIISCCVHSTLTCVITVPPFWSASAVMTNMQIGIWPLRETLLLWYDIINIETNVGDNTLPMCTDTQRINSNTTCSQLLLSRQGFEARITKYSKVRKSCFLHFNTLNTAGHGEHFRYPAMFKRKSRFRNSHGNSCLHPDILELVACLICA